MDIVHPSMDQLLPKVDSKYTLVVLAAKRARQILAGSPVKSVLQSHKDVTNALEEVAEDKITFARVKKAFNLNERQANTAFLLIKTVNINLFYIRGLLC